MATEVESNPLFANNPPGALLTPAVDGWWGLDPNVSLATLNPTTATLGANVAAPGAGVGLVVSLQGWNGVSSAASGSPTHPTVALSTSGTGGIIGVVQGAQTGLSPVTVVGQAVKVKTFGIGLVRVDNTTIVGNALVVGSTAGVAHDSGGVTGTTNETIGIALQALTVNSGLGIIYALIKLS